MCLAICAPVTTIQINLEQKLPNLLQLINAERAAFCEFLFSLGRGPCFHRECVNVLHLSFELQNCEKKLKTNGLQSCCSQFHGLPFVFVTAACLQIWHLQWWLQVLRHNCRFRQIYYNEWRGWVGMLPMNAWLSWQFRISARWTWQQRINHKIWDSVG